MVAEDESGKKPRAPFRFLKPEEYEALSHRERASYLKEALEALRSGRPVDIPSDRERKH